VSRPGARAACALLALATLGTAPAPAYGPVPSGAMTVLARRYVAALRAGDYATAFRLLTVRERA
jgi:hypothetical protein